MKYNKILLFIGLALITPSSLWAQKKILTEKVEVTKSYIPKIGKASKRDIQPQTEEVMQLEVPKLKYSISYKPEKYPFVVNQLDIPSYKRTEEKYIYNGYADVALAAPFMSRVNLFYTSTELRNTIYGASVSHKGFWGDLKDNLGKKRSASETENDLSLFFEYHKDMLKAKVSATQSYDAFSRYGYNTASEKTNKQHYIKSSIKAEVGTSFYDLERFNVSLGASTHIVSDKYGYNESTYEIGILMSKGFSSINSLLEGRVEYISSIPTRKFNLFQIYGETPIERPIPQPGDTPSEDIKYSPTGLLSIAPRYIFNYKGVDIDLGLNMSLDFHGKSTNYKQGIATVLPQAELSYSFKSGGFTPYAKMDGSYIFNNYYTLSEQNPYIMEGLTAPNTTIKRYMIGARGGIKSNFSYDFHIGLRQSRDLLMYVNIEDGNIFSVLRGDFDNTEYALELGYICNSIFSFNAKLVYIDYDNKGALDDNIAIGHAPLTANIKINYFPTKKLSLSLEGELLSSREFGSLVYNGVGSSLISERELVINKVGATFDLSLAGEYKLSDRMSASLRFGNLLNHELYPYNNYRGIGLNVMAGISYKF